MAALVSSWRHHYRRILKQLTPAAAAVTFRLSSTSATIPDENDGEVFVPRRALLYVPASSDKMLNKISSIQADCVVVELEDGVSPTAKEAARRNARQYFDSMADIDDDGDSDRRRTKLKCHEVGLRLNSVASGMIDADLKEVSQSAGIPDAFMIPKVDSIENDLMTIWRLFRQYYGDRIARRRRKVAMVIWIESASALVSMPRLLHAAINMASSLRMRLDAVVFGSDDYCADIGASRSNAEAMLYARQRFVACCKAHRLQAIDQVYTDIANVAGLEASSLEGHSWGFTGKQCIHPNQVPIVHRCFSPSNEQRQWAIGVVDEYERHAKVGTGAFTYKGHMIDRPLLLQARNIVRMMTLFDDTKPIR